MSRQVFVFERKTFAPKELQARKISSGVSFQFVHKKNPDGFRVKKRNVVLFYERLQFSRPGGTVNPLPRPGLTLFFLHSSEKQR